MTRVMRRKSAVELLGVPAMAKVGRERLVDVAIDLFYTYGFNAVGLDRVLAEAGVTKTTFYKHFESKDDLAIAALEKRETWEARAWKQAIEELAGDDPREQLLAMFEVMDIWFNDEDFKGCIFINAASEFPNPSDPIHQIAAKHKRETRDWFRDIAKAAGADEPEAFADAYMMLVEGTLVMRQVHGRDDAARVAKSIVGKLLENHGVR